MPTFTVTTLDDEAFDNDGNDATDGSGLSLREALGLADASAGGDAIEFATALAGGTITLGSELAITAGTVFIDGDTNGDNAADITISGGATGTATSGGLTGGSRIFNISGTSTDVTLDGLILTNGHVETGDPSDVGGAVRLADGILTIRSSTLRNNEGESAGAIFSSGTLVIEDSLIVSNFASGTVSARGDSGAISSDDDLTISRTTVAFNSATSFIGGINQSGGTLTLTDSTIVGNTAVDTSAGVDLDVFSSTANVTGTLIANVPGTNSIATASSGMINFNASGDRINVVTDDVTGDTGITTNLALVVDTATDLLGSGTLDVNLLRTAAGQATEVIAVEPGSDAVVSNVVQSGATAVLTNTPPTFSGLDATPSFTEGGSATLIDTNAALSDTEQDALNTGAGDYNAFTITVARIGGANADDRFSFTSTGGVTIDGNNLQSSGNTFGTFIDDGNGALTITFNNSEATATSALADSVLRGISYANISDDPTGSVTLDFTANDGSLDSTGTNQIVVTLTGINDAPTLTATGTNPTYTEGASASDLFSGVTVNTVEIGQTITAFELTVTNVAPGDQLSIDGSVLSLADGINVASTATNSLNVSVSNPSSTATVSFSAAALTEAQLQTLVDGLTFSSTANNPGSLNRVVTLTSVTDSGGTANSGAETTPLSLVSSVTVTSVNDAPAITSLFGETSTVIVGSSVAALSGFADAVVGDADSSDFNGGSLSIVQNSGTTNGTFGLSSTVTAGGDAVLAAGEAVAVSGTTIGTVDATDDGQGGNSLTITFTTAGATPANVQALLRALTYDAPSGFDTRGFTLTLTDADGTANGGDEDASGTFSISVTPNPPVFSNLDGDTVTYLTTNTAPVPLDAGAAVSITDADSTDFDTGVLTIAYASGQQSEDRLVINTEGMVSLSDSQNASSIVSVGGTAIGSIDSGATGGDSENLSITLTASATPALTATLLQAVQYNNTASAGTQTVGARVLSVTLSDGDGSTSAAATVTATVATPPPPPPPAPAPAPPPVPTPPPPTVIDSEASDEFVESPDGDGTLVFEVEDGDDTEFVIDASTLTETISVVLGTADNSVTVGVAGGSVTTGAGDQTLDSTAVTDPSVITTASFGAGNHIVTGGTGSEVITLVGGPGVTRLTLGPGDDRAALSLPAGTDGDTVLIIDASGTDATDRDTVVLDGGTIGTAATLDITVLTGDDADTVIFTLPALSPIAGGPTGGGIIDVTAEIDLGSGGADGTADVFTLALPEDGTAADAMVTVTGGPGSQVVTVVQNTDGPLSQGLTADAVAAAETNANDSAALTIALGGDDDIVEAGNLADDLNGQSGDDLIQAYGGDDRIQGGNGADEIFGGAGDDSIQAGGGRDMIAGGSGDDTINGRHGWDTVLGGDGDDSIIGAGGFDVIDGGAGRDTVFAGVGRDTVTGGNGADLIYGEEASDILDGGAVGDTLVGGSGNDTITGGEGGDLFVFEAGHGRDVLTDFDAAAGDQLDLTAVTGDFTSAADVRVASAVISEGVRIDTGDGLIILAGITSLDILTEDSLILG